MTDDAVVKILNKLPNNFLDKYSDWIKVLSVMKKHNKLEIWNIWCKKSNKYNYERNMRFWNYNKGVLDINYLIWELNKQGHDMEYIRRYKPYIPLTRNISGMKKITFNHPFVYDRSNKTNTYNYHHFEDHSTSIIKSCTGTGKTTAIANHMKTYMNTDKKAKLLSITTRTTLSYQHVLSFQLIGMKDYRAFTGNIYDTASITICLNSLSKLYLLDEEELNDYVIYLDEVSSFLELTHNNTLDKT